MSSSARLMKAFTAKTAQITYPTGNPNFSVYQAFPAAISAETADPFLMCDHFGPTPSKGKAKHEDDYEVAWHPHRGMDILTYLIKGVGRHADSLGNRGVYKTPGMQWISVGSGIEHAEGGGTPKGEEQLGFQIWINVPAKHKMDDPRYGVEPPENIPVFQSEGMSARLLAGKHQELQGPFKTVQPVQIVDFNLLPDASCAHEIPRELDNCLAYVYEGAVTINGVNVPKYNVLRLDASSHDMRGISLTAGKSGANVIVFSGKRINEPIAWHGPFVMNTNEEIRRTIEEYRNGTFLKKRAAWDYKQISTKPKLESDDSLCL